MKKYWQLVIILTSFTGLFINVLVSSVKDPFSLLRGLGLFRYYTLQSNLLVLLVFVLLYHNASTLKKHFVVGVTVYITITFTVFALMLSTTYQPQGWNQVSNILSHYVTPVLVMSYTIYHKTDFTVKMFDSVTWLMYPVGYVLFMIGYGTITGDYLYPFFQVNVVGLFAFMVTLLILILYFFLLSFLFVKIVSFRKKMKTN